MISGLAFEEMRVWVKSQVRPPRFRHIEGVVECAEKLALQHGLSADKARIAAILHDCAKELPKKQMEGWIAKAKYRLDPLERHIPALWHPHAGAGIARWKWGIKDPVILEAIRCHTLGGPRMGLLSQLIFVADYIEKGRKFPGVQKARQAAKKGLREGVLEKCIQSMRFMLEKGRAVHPRMLETWNRFLTVP